MTVSGTLFILSAPSGAGKTSLVKALVAEFSSLKISVSHTTRLPRSREVDGVDYNFVNLEAFKKSLDANLFLEHAQVFGNYYGTSREWVDATLKQGYDVLLEIDWQGAQQVRQLFANTVSIYILPPAIKELLQRLQNRNQDSLEVIARRIQQAKYEIEHYHEYDYLLVNEHFVQAVQDLIIIVKASQFKTRRQQQVNASLIEELRVIDI